MSLNTCEELSPNDLGIQKQRLVAFPKPEEVVIFRSRIHSKVEPPQNLTYDQIHWTKGGEARIDVVIAPLSFYLGYPEPETNSREQLFRDSWRLRAGGYRYTIKDYTFIGSHWGSSAERTTGRFTYTKNYVTKSEDLVFEFEMFVMPISKAKLIHPELEEWDAKIENGTTLLQAAFILNEEAEQGAPSNGG